MSQNSNYPVPPQNGGYYPPQGGPRNFVVLNNKSTLVAYILWFFFGNLGIHRFYLGSPVFGGIQLALGVFGWATSWILIGWLFLIPLWIWLLFDLIWIPMRTGAVNNAAMENIASKLS